MAKITTGQMFEQWELMNQKLEALDNKINGIIDGSTPANTQLTGSNVEKRKVIKSHTVAHDLIGNYLFVGEDIAAGSTSVTFLDVSMYESIAVIIKNNLDVAVEGVYGALNTAAKRSSSDFREEYKIGDAIPSGATVFFSAEDVQGTTFSPYMYLQILVSNPTQGSLDIAFVGGR